jgi:hypothetical protein
VVARERLHALRALDGTLASGWHGRGAVHGRARAKLAQGIGPGGRRGAGGVVTARGMLGAMLSMLGAHGGRGGILGERGVARLRRCEVGSSEGISRDGVHPLGVGDGGGGRREGRGERVLAGVASGSSSSPRFQPDTTRGRSLSRFLAGLLENCW